MPQPSFEGDSDTGPLYSKLLVDEAQLDERVEEMAADIITDFKAEHPLFVCLLRGGVPFMSRLMHAIVRQDPRFHPEVDYMTIKTYGDSLVDKPPELIMGLSPSTKVSGRLVLPIDDTLDKGRTLDFTERHLYGEGALDVQAIVMVQKNLARIYAPKVAMFGFESPPDWLTGSGLDDPRIGKEANRWMSGFAIANAQVDSK